MPKKKLDRRTQVALPPEMSSNDEGKEAQLASNQGVGTKIPVSRIVITLVLVILLVVVILARKGLILAATVNGRPIFRWDLTNVLMARYGQQTLEGMISEQIINDAAQNAGVQVSQSDIDTKTNELLKSLGGSVNIDQVLKMQGMTRQDFDKQLRIQMTVEKLLGKNISITDKDVDQFIATNRAQLSATGEAEMKDEAKKLLLETQVREKFQTWFNELKQKAQVTRFL